MNTVWRMLSNDKQEYKQKIAAMTDGEVEAEYNRVGQELAALQTAIDNMKNMVISQPELTDPAAVTEFLSEALVNNNTEIAAARVLQKNGQWKQQALLSQMKSRRLRAAYIALMEDAAGKVNIFEEAAAAVQEHTALAQKMGGRPIIAPGLAYELQQAANLGKK